jgi:hypothetical protein
MRYEGEGPQENFNMMSVDNPERHSLHKLGRV